MTHLLALSRRLGLNSSPQVHFVAREMVEKMIGVSELFGAFRTPAGEYLPHRLAMVLGLYESDEMEIARRAITPHSVVLDIGANVGYFSVQLARQLKTGRILAFEPNPSLYGLLQKNLRRVSRVQPYKLGLSDVDAELEFSVAGKNYATGSLVPNYSQLYQLHPDGGNVSRFAVQVRNGSAFLAARGIAAVDFIKLDVEGWEIQVLRGLEKVIRNSRNVRVLVEFNPLAQTTAGFATWDLYELLQRFGFVVYEPCTQGTLQPITSSGLDALIQHLGPRGYTSFFCTKEAP